MILSSIPEEQLNRHGIKKCDKCSGTGLKNYKQYGPNNYTWNGELCDKCNGNGYIGEFFSNPINDKYDYICPHCKGVGKGCKYCSDGVVDWVSRVTRKAS